MAKYVVFYNADDERVDRVTPVLDSVVRIRLIGSAEAEKLLEEEQKSLPKFKGGG